MLVEWHELCCRPLWPKMDIPQSVLSVVSRWLQDEFAARWRLVAHGAVQRATRASTMCLHLVAAATTRMASRMGRLGGSQKERCGKRHEAGGQPKGGGGAAKAEIRSGREWGAHPCFFVGCSEVARTFASKIFRSPQATPVTC